MIQFIVDYPRARLTRKPISCVCLPEQVQHAQAALASTSFLVYSDPFSLIHLLFTKCLHSEFLEFSEIYLYISLLNYLFNNLPIYYSAN